MRKLENLHKIMNRDLNRYVKNSETAHLRASKNVLNEAKENVPVKSGDLKKSLKLKKEKENKTNYKVVSNLSYAEIVDKGSAKVKASLYLTKASSNYHKNFKKEFNKIRKK